MKAMKLAVFALLLAACASTAPPSPPRSVMIVDRTYDRAKPQPSGPDNEIPPASYTAVTPADRWSVAIDGTTIVLTPLDKADGRIEGSEMAGGAGERRFQLTKGVFAGGRFVLRGDEAELTIYGSGVPVVSSERGKIVTK